jgi:hypothetical protein
MRLQTRSSDVIGRRSCCRALCLSYDRAPAAGPTEPDELTSPRFRSLSDLSFSGGRSTDPLPLGIQNARAAGYLHSKLAVLQLQLGMDLFFFFSLEDS